MKYVIFFGILLLVNLNAFLLMRHDKRLAQKGQWRVPEKTLFLAALLMGGVGATFGMKKFRHKTKHLYFRYGFPLIAAVQIALCVWVLCRYRNFFC